MMRYYAFFAALGFASSSWGQPPQDALNDTIAELKHQRSKASELSQRVARVDDELADLQRQSTKLVDNIRRVQDRIASNRKDIARLERKQAERRRALNARRDDIARLLHGMIRLQRLPRHFVMARPGETNQLLRTASALDVTYKAAHSELQDVNRAFMELTALAEQLQRSQQALSVQLQTVQQQQAALTDTVAARRQLQQSLRADHGRVKQRVRQLSDKSGDLQELIARLESETMLFRELGTPPRKPDAPAHEATRAAKESFTARKGGLAYPAQGRLVHRFGDKRGADDSYRGVEIHTAAGAPVTAPHSGKVMFSGRFMDYGPMVIIQHDKAYHSVIAGLDVVEVEPGQPVTRDELVGMMGASTTSRTLYFELRKHSKAIDPATWMGNVSLASR